MSEIKVEVKLNTEEVKIITNLCPLFDKIVKSIPLDFKYDPIEICNILSHLKDENQEHVCCLIHHYRTLNPVLKIKKTGLVYNGKIMGENKTGCLWKFSDLPDGLQKILAKFALYIK